MRAGLATTTLATMALPLPRMSIVEAAIFVYLTVSASVLTTPVRAQVAGSAGAIVSHIITRAAAAVSQGVNNAAAGVAQVVNGAAAGLSHGSNQTAAGSDVSHGTGGAGSSSGAAHCRPSYNNNHHGNGSTNTPTTPGRGTGHIPGLPMPRAGEFLVAHNKIRASVNEPPMRWDTVLARYARRFAARRAVDCKMLHSYGPYGENIFWGEKDVWTPAQVVQSWASENQYYDRTNNTCVPGQMCGHYTQMVWLDSTRLGCAMVTCLNGGMYTICNYDPPGNFVNESPFKPYRGTE